MEEVNPLRVLRKRAGYSLKKLSQLSELSIQTLINNEAGTYVLPSPALLDFYEMEVNEVELIEQYRAFQKATRISNYGVLLEPLPDWKEIDLEGLKHPVGAWCAASNIPFTRISKLFCVHQSLLYRLEHKHQLMNSLPGQLTDALIESGYSPVTLTEIEGRFVYWKKHLRLKMVS